MKEFLENLLKSLNCIEVKGKENLDVLLGCMMAIENAINELENPQVEEENDG